METTKRNIVQIIIIILSIVVVAVLGSVFVNLGMDWFNSLVKPTQWIPNILIPIVWTVIYIAFGVILSIWSVRNEIPTNIIVWLVINGILNVVWCLVFFTLKLTLVGNIAIILNLIAGYFLLRQILKCNKLYGIIISIYPIWLSIATSLNIALWNLN